MASWVTTTAQEGPIHYVQGSSLVDEWLLCLPLDLRFMGLHPAEGDGCFRATKYEACLSPEGK
jgi:hypothetical protein